MPGLGSASGSLGVPRPEGRRLLVESSSLPRSRWPRRSAVDVPPGSARPAGRVPWALSSHTRRKARMFGPASPASDAPEGASVAGGRRSISTVGRGRGALPRRGSSRVWCNMDSSSEEHETCRSLSLGSPPGQPKCPSRASPRRTVIGRMSLQCSGGPRRDRRGRPVNVRSARAASRRAGHRLKGQLLRRRRS
jgi:hypothetical protein